MIFLEKEYKVVSSRFSPIFGKQLHPFDLLGVSPKNCLFRLLSDMWLFCVKISIIGLQKMTDGDRFFWHFGRILGGGWCFHEKKVDVFFFLRGCFFNRGGVGEITLLTMFGSFRSVQKRCNPKIWRPSGWLELAGPFWVWETLARNCVSRFCLLQFCFLFCFSWHELHD